MNNILLWATNGILKATLVKSSPQKFLFERNVYVLKDFDLGDVDYLRNRNHELVGFAYIVGNEIDKEFVRLIERQSKTIYLKDGFLFIFISPSDEFEIETVQGIGSHIYHDCGENIMLLIPDLGLGKLAFDLTSGEDGPAFVGET